MENRTIWLTGLGCLTGAGTGRAAIADLLVAPTLPLQAVDRSAGFHLPKGARLALPVRELEPGRWVAPGDLRRMSRPSRLAVSAAYLALEEAGLTPDALPSERTGIWLATAFGPSEFTEALLRQILIEGPQSASPLHFTESVANAPAAQIARQLQARGPNLTISQREAGLAAALAGASRALANGRVEVAVVGWVDELTPLLHAVLDRFRALARAAPDQPGGETPRPFDRRRNGVLATEGAVIAILESRRRVVSRGGRGMARVRPLGSAFDPECAAIGWSMDPARLAAALGDALKRAGIEPGSIDAVVSGASGSRGGDRLEGRALACLWSDGELPPILAPKGWLGECPGAQFAAVIHALEGGVFGPVPGFAEEDPEIGLSPFPGGALQRASRLLIPSLAQGGAATWTLIERAEA